MVLLSKDRILVPIDFSEEAFEVLKDTLAFAGEPSAVHALYVMSPLEPTDPGIIWQTIDEEKRKEDVMETFAAKFPLDQYPGLNVVLEIGDPSAQIIDYAAEKDMELIVMLSKGRKGISRFFVGTVTERVTRFSDCPVLVMRH
ncbi:MAG: universal stress protein [Cyanobacteria bacterium P01_D01_bin.105]